MNKHVMLHSDVLVCGTITEHGICLRPPGHWASHVARKKATGTYWLVHTSCWPISFEIAESIALVAMQNKDWSWYE